MGQSTSNVIKKYTGWGGGANGTSVTENNASQNLTRAYIKPYVYQRPSNEYRDSDGDIAHEFYEQQTVTYKTPNSRKRKSKIVMKRIPSEELHPLKFEKLPHPALSVDYPVILCGVQQFQR